RLVGNGQLEMVTGGWVMPDEANSHYFAMIDQLIEGHQWLEKNIGVTPRSGWAVDPFGHSSTMPYLLKRANLTGMLIQRVHYAIKKHFAATQNLEFMWRQTWGEGLLGRRPQRGPCRGGWQPGIATDHVPVRMASRAPGGDGSALQWFCPVGQPQGDSPLCPVVGRVGSAGKGGGNPQPQEPRRFPVMLRAACAVLQAQFGTLSDYFDALYKKVGIVPGMKPPGFPVLSGDFFSYADREDHYWTGYYTSRPFYKSLDRVLEAHLRGAEILYSLALAHARHAGTDGRYPLSDYALLSNARRNLGLFQHHDAITGTAKEAVAVDYGVRLFHSLTNLKRVIINAAHYLVLGDKDAYRHDPAAPFLGTDDTRPNQDSLPERTVVKLDASPRFLVVFNPLEQERLSVLPVLVDSPHVPGPHAPAALLQRGWLRSSCCPQVSVLARLPALGLRVLQLHKSFDGHATLKSSVRLYLHGRGLPVRKQEAVPVHVFPATADDFCLENQHLQACFLGRSGLLQASAGSIRRAGEEREQRVSSKFFVYGTRTSKDKSGAYLFLPDGEAKPYTPKDPPVVRVTEGPLFSEVASYYQHVQTIVRLYNVPGVEGLSLDVSCLVDIRDHINKELALRFSTDIESDDTFFTDLNGFQIQPRRYQQKLPLQANFYPMPAMAYIQDTQSRLTLHTAQALGVSSLGSGQLEVILDRRLMQDDNRGLGQGLKDNKRTCNRFRLLLERRTTANKDGRPISFPSLLSHITSMHLNAEALVMPVAQEKPAPPALRSFMPLSTTLPCDFHILNLRMLQAEDDSLPSAEAALILHRKGFDCSLEAKNLGFNCTTSQGKLALGSLFQGLELGSLQPTSLTLMYPLGTASNSTNIHLDPMEIATFRIRLG
ncbi:MA2A2 mannosidase, partial [Fregetta grallaria]|nr:MA2A2 mannosidase [Fregetta grallaria]